MIPPFVRGSIAPVFTAFNQDGTLDDAGQREFMDFLVERGGIGAYFVRSGMGQMYTFSFDDVKQLAQNVCPHMQGKGPVLVGVSGEWDRDRTRRPDRNTFISQCKELTLIAADAGASGVVYTMPEALVPEPGQTHAELVIDFFRMMSELSPVPVFVYQSPGTEPEYMATVEVAAAIADLPNVVAMKASTSDAMLILDTCWAVRGKDFAFISGNETAFLAGLVAGSAAVIGQGATVNPKILNAIQDRYDAGDLNGALDAQRSTNILVQRARNAQEFMKRYAVEHGYQVQPYGRVISDDGYKTRFEPLSEDEYNTFKRLVESESEKYA